MACGWAFSIPTTVIENTRKVFPDVLSGEDEYFPVEGGARKIELDEWNVHLNVTIVRNVLKESMAVNSDLDEQFGRERSRKRTEFLRGKNVQGATLLDLLSGQCNERKYSSLVENHIQCDRQ